MQEQSVHPPIAQVSTSLQEAYPDFYSDRTTAWREMGARYKAQNIIHVSRGRRFPRVLECGAGDGSIIKYLDQHSFCEELFAIEISDSGIAQMQKHDIKSLKEIKKFDGYQIPYADGEFDLAYCSHVIEHVEHPRLLLRELKRVSKFQIFEVPLDYSPHVDTQIEHFLGYGHINIYTPSLFKFLLKSEGFKVHEQRVTNIPKEVLSFIADKKATSTKRSMMQALKLFLHPVLKVVKWRFIKLRYSGEYGFSAFTCLTSGEGKLRVFDAHANSL
ncbi:MAG: class I SAM-dependent methyltransferase [Rhizobacter sp.]